MSWLEIFMAEAEKRNAETREAVKKARAEAYAAREKCEKRKSRKGAVFRKERGGCRKASEENG